MKNKQVDKKAKISIQRLKVSAAIGILPWELQNRQDVYIDLEFWINAAKIALTDQIQDAIDYAEVCQCIRTFVAEQRFNLIETFAERLADQLQSQFLFSKFSLTIAKLNIFPDMGLVKISIVR